MMDNQVLSVRKQIGIKYRIIPDYRFKGEIMDIQTQKTISIEEAPVQFSSEQIQEAVSSLENY